jgi:hypothetical protein
VDVAGNAANTQTAHVRHKKLCGYVTVHIQAHRENHLLRAARMTVRRGSFEVQVAHKGVYGFIDMYSCDNIVWEFKCTSELSDEHILQTALYLWLWRGQQLTQLLMDDSDIGVDVTEARSRIEATRAILFNIFTGEQVEVQAATDELVDALRAHKMAAMATTPDDEIGRPV